MSDEEHTHSGVIPYCETANEVTQSNLMATCDSLVTLETGQSIVLHLTSGVSENATLQLTLKDGDKTNAIPCYFVGDTRLGSQYSAGANIILNYDGSAWRVVNPYRDASVYDRVRCINDIYILEDVSASRIICNNGSGYFTLREGSTFDISYPLLWLTQAAVSGNTSTNGYYIYPTCTLRNNNNQATFDLYQQCYVVGYLSGSKFTVDADIFASAPSEADGKIYIPIGLTCSAYEINFNGNPIQLFAYKEGVGFAPIGGQSGEQGQSLYTWVKYADDSSGNGMSDDPTDKSYVGFAYNKETSVPSTDPKDYAPWALIKGSSGKDAILLRIDSTRGVVFKNNEVSTILNVVIYYGSQRITNPTELASALGSGARLQWEWLRLDDETYGTIVPTDSRLSNGGFYFTLSPEDVDVKVTFRCNLIIE